MTEETSETIAQTENESEESTEEKIVDENELESVGETEAVDTPEFSDLSPGQVGAAVADLNRLNDVEVTVSAELGRTKVPIEQLLKLNVGSVFELCRSIDSPVELMAQGVPLGNGEVVVVDGNFAVRIQEIYARQ